MNDDKRHPASLLNRSRWQAVLANFILTIRLGFYFDRFGYDRLCIVLVAPTGTIWAATDTRTRETVPTAEVYLLAPDDS